MPLFFDTNVPVGYIFKWDPWHSYADKAFANGDSKYWSQTVVNETHKKFKEKKQDYSYFLSDVYRLLEKKKGFFKKDDLISFALKSRSSLKNDKKIIIIEKIWESEGFNYDENIDLILKSLNQIIMDFNSDVYLRKNQFQSNMILHHRQKNYPKLKDKLKKKIHHPDYDIVLDAHDLCSIHSNLEFITSDYREENIEFIKSETDISTITDLRKFIT